MNSPIAIEAHNIPVCGPPQTPLLNPDCSTIEDLIVSAKPSKRSLSQINVIHHMMKTNKIFQELPFSPKQLEGSK